MVRNYERKTNRQEWSEEKMEQAVAAVTKKEMGLRKASVQFNVPKTTLQRAVQNKLKDNSFKIDKSRGKYKAVFSQEQEAELVAYLKDMEGRLFGFTMKECRAIAFELAERNKLKHPFNKELKMAGEDWMSQFLSRHPDLSIRKPEATSGARAMGFNRPNVTKFFDLLTEIVDRFQLTADRVYNCDETGISVNPKGHSKIIAPRGKRQVGVLTSSEKGETVTAEICVSGAGAFMPPMLIFPRQRMQKEFELGLPPGGWAECHETGWINKDIFTKWFAKFVKFSKASKDNVVLLILDGHATHTKNLQVIDTARENGVVMLCLPPHASHRLQPLDVSLMKPISSYYEQETRKWLRTHPGKVITLWQIASLFGAAFISAANMRSAIKGFQATGIWPVNMDVFTDADFLPSAPTDRALEETSTDTPSSSAPTNDSALNSTSAQATREDAVELTPTKGVSLCIPSTSTKFPRVSPQQVSAIPKVVAQEPRRKRKKGCAAILTASPYKNELKEAIEKSNRKVEEREERARKRLKFIPGTKKVKQNAKKGTRQKKKLEEQDDSEDDDNDAECLYCNELYSCSTEGWVACVSCHNWAHNSCAGIDSEDDEPHICAICVDNN